MNFLKLLFLIIFLCSVNFYNLQPASNNKYLLLLKKLFIENYVVFNDLVEKSRNKNYSFISSQNLDTKKVLYALGLCDRFGNLIPEIRAIILSSVKGSGMKMSILDPNNLTDVSNPTETANLILATGIIGTTIVTQTNNAQQKDKNKKKIEAVIGPIGSIFPNPIKLTYAIRKENIN